MHIGHTQFDLFATASPHDTYTFSVPRIGDGVTPTDGVSVAAPERHPRAGGYAVAHDARGALSATTDVPPADHAELPDALVSTAAAPPGLLTMPDGTALSVDGPWSASRRLQIVQYLLHTKVGAPVRWRRLVTPRTPTLTAARTGHLYGVGDASRDVIAHVHGGGAPDARQSRTSLHLSRAFVEEMNAYDSAVQCVVTRIRRASSPDLLVVAAIPWEVLAPIAADCLAVGDGKRAALQCEIACSDRGLTLRIPEADLDVSHYAGVGSLAAALRGHPGAPWRAWTHSDWMAVVTAVLTLRDGLHCSVAPLDARKRINRAVLDELGIRGVHGHRLDLPAASEEALAYTDVLAAPTSAALRQEPDQSVIALEIDAESDMTAVQELALRIHSAKRLGLTVTRAIVVADEAKRSKFEARRATLDPELRGCMEFWSMAEVYRQYRAVRTARFRELALAQRELVRRAA